MKKNPMSLISLMNEEYRKHLKSILKEINVFDSRDKIVIGPDLKVIHEPSGFEYTVKDVKGPIGKAKIILRSPESPRFITKSTDVQNSRIRPVSAAPVPDSNEADGSIDDEDDKDYGKEAWPKDNLEDKKAKEFVVDQKEFEKNYREA